MSDVWNCLSYPRTPCVCASLKEDLFVFLVSSFSAPAELWQNTGPTKSKRRPFSPFVFTLFESFLFPLFSPAVWRSPLASSPYPAEISLFTSMPGNSAGSPRGRRWTTRPGIICSGSGPITIAPWTSQTPQDWVGERGSSGVWGVSGPEPARRPVRQPNPSQACQPPLTQACRRPWPTQDCRRQRPTQVSRPQLSRARRHSRAPQASRRPRLIHSHRSRSTQACRRSRLIHSRRSRPTETHRRPRLFLSRRRSRPKQARLQWVWQARLRFLWQACRSWLLPGQRLDSVLQSPLLDSVLQCRPLECA